MKRAIVTGAFGFAGANLVEQLLELGYRVYAVGRAGSAHNERLKESDQLKKIYLDMNEYVIEGEELLARAICHELDHLDGHMYVEKVEGDLVDNEELMAQQEAEAEAEGEEE